MPIAPVAQHHYDEQAERTCAQLEPKLAALREEVEAARTAAMSLREKDAWERQENRLLQVCPRVCVCGFMCKCTAVFVVSTTRDVMCRCACLSARTLECKHTAQDSVCTYVIAGRGDCATAATAALGIAASGRRAREGARHMAGLLVLICHGGMVHTIVCAHSRANLCAGLCYHRCALRHICTYNVTRTWAQDQRISLAAKGKENERLCAELKASEKQAALATELQKELADVKDKLHNTLAQVHASIKESVQMCPDVVAHPALHPGRGKRLGAHPCACVAGWQIQ